VTHRNLSGADRAAHRAGSAPWALVRRPPQAPSGSGRSAASAPAAWWLFENPFEVLDAPDPDGVPTLLAQVEEAAARGLWSVGFVGYEAAPAFDGAFRTHPLPRDVPAAWFALYGPPRELAVLPTSPGIEHPLVRDLAPSVGEEEYLAAVEEVRRWIAAGETYQANLTYRLRGRLAHGPGTPLALFHRLVGDRPPAYATYLELGARPGPDRQGGFGSAVCSASPELFFERAGERIVCRPMKGTAPRGRTVSEDLAAAVTLESSTKERAENLMIVDMVRNDLGRIARPGSVAVAELFQVERYPTLFQMTSKVEAGTAAGLAEIFGALFPCASITGAPKVRTMELLADLESCPRGVYTGAIGYVAPGGHARFSVAIRTAWITEADPPGAEAGARVEYGTGGGVVWDSVPRRELAETRTKALVLTRALGAQEAAPRLLETLLWRPGKGYFLYARHLARLTESASYFDFAIDAEDVALRLEAAERELLAAGSGPARVRLLLDQHGSVEILSEPFEPSQRPWRLALAAVPVDERDPLLFHKTTRRTVYERARSGAPEADDVLLWNRSGELTESTVANLVLELDGALVTPNARCGLLPGTLRSELLEQGTVSEERLVVEDLLRADRIWLVNSLRGWIPASLLDREAVESRAAGGLPTEEARQHAVRAPNRPADRLPFHRPR